MKFGVLYEDDNVLVIEKPAGIVVFPAAPEGEPRQRREREIKEKTLIDFLLEKFPYLKSVGETPRYGIVHRLDRDTSGILLVAKSDKALKFFQKEFKEGRVLKKYLALVVGNLKENQGKIETLIGRSPKDRKKQKAFSFFEPGAKRKGLRKAITEYKVLERFRNFTLVEVIPKTGRKHQIRCHFNYLGHPVAGDKLYGFKSQPKPENLKRHFLHASQITIKLPDGKERKFGSELPEDLEEILKSLNSK